MFNRFLIAVSMTLMGLRQGASARLAPARGLSMLEYALMALVVIALFGILIVFFPDFVNNITGQFNTLFQNSCSSGTSGGAGSC